MQLTVLARRSWQIHWGGLLHGTSGGIDGQVTKCRLPDGLVFYVRENSARDHFNTSAGERMAMKRGSNTRGRNVLELCCAADRWDEVAALVTQVDPMKRRVRANRQFTKDWAERALAGAKKEETTVPTEPKKEPKEPKKPDPSLLLPCPKCRAPSGSKCKNYLGKGKATCQERKLSERQKHDCPRCGARAGDPCVDYNGKPLAEDAWREPVCQERGRPEITAKKLAKKADELNAKALKAAGGGNTLLSYLHDGDDNLLAAEGVTKVTAADLAAQKLRAERFKEDHGHAEHGIKEGLNWILMRHLRRVAAELIGAEWERILWEGGYKCHGNALDYIVDRYRDCLCTTKSFALGFERKFDPTRVKTWYLEPNEYRAHPIEMKNDGWYVVPTGTWPPAGYTPVMTREEFNARFNLHHLSVRPAEDLSEPDDDGLFDRTIGALSRSL
jgi:hypothetical protein